MTHDTLNHNSWHFNDKSTPNKLLNPTSQPPSPPTPQLSQAEKLRSPAVPRSFAANSVTVWPNSEVSDSPGGIHGVWVKSFGPIGFTCDASPYQNLFDSKMGEQS